MKKSVIAYLLTAGAAMAHPGHVEAVAYGEAHWLTQGDHLAAIAGLGLVVLAGALRLRRRPVTGTA